MLWPHVVEKFHRLVAPLGNAAAREAVVQAVQDLESIDAVELMQALKAVRKTD